MRKKQEINSVKSLHKPEAAKVRATVFGLEEEGESFQKKRKDGEKSRKRTHKDSKFGFGGRKRGLKSNTRESLNSFNDIEGRPPKRQKVQKIGGKYEFIWSSQRHTHKRKKERKEKNSLINKIYIYLGLSL